ncbi:CPXCG motif-containing cysteine-rich protein [Xanthomonas sp. AmX2]|uniref:CPXCG motif-containing cysteine-rich protein n=1 Tax=Xanthomonas sp. TaxID=29446 RepID=UPI0019804FB3|nr:CPXCG motif-containing cysteine-rich protein [Xanthomonas sp.]MBN6151311.1 CPXCG motif-containing cysteine-rich protein [Xanthomonas sp.]
MSAMQPFVDIQCPYCGEWIDLALDPSAGAQQYVEDCQVCCKPMLIAVSWDEDGEPSVRASAENDG